MNRYLGFGTYGLTGPNAQSILLDALSMGANLIDTAEAYGNADAVLSIIKNYAQYNADRNQITVFYKMWYNSSQSVSDQLGSVIHLLDSCRMIIATHWPPNEYRRAIDDLLRFKQHHAIEVGLSNYSIELCRKISKEYPSSYIWGMESEMHPFYKNRERLQYCIDNNWHFIAASPLYRCMKSDPVLALLAKKYCITQQQLMLLWSRQQKAIPIPTTLKSAHLHDILFLPDLVIDDKDMITINGIRDVSCKERICFEMAYS